MLRLHGTCLWPVDLGRRRDLWPVESPYEITLLQSVVTCVVLVISALWLENNVKPYVYPSGSVICPFGYSTGPCGCRTGLGILYEQSFGVVRGMCGGHTGSVGTIRPASPYMKLPASFSGPVRAETLIARHVARALRHFV